MSNAIKVNTYYHTFTGGLELCYYAIFTYDDPFTPYRQLHGQFLRYYEDGSIENVRFFKLDENITNEVKDLVSDIKNLTSEDKMIIKLKFGIKCL